MGHLISFPQQLKEALLRFRVHVLQTIHSQIVPRQVSNFFHLCLVGMVNPPGGRLIVDTPKHVPVFCLHSTRLLLQVTCFLRRGYVGELRAADPPKFGILPAT